MAAADDDIEKLLREVDGALGGGSSASSASSAPVRREPAAAPDRGGRLQAAIPRATAVGAAWGVGVGGVFFVLPFLSSFSGAVAAFATGFAVSLLGRLRRG